jgi:hypothetical protein
MYFDKTFLPVGLPQSLSPGPQSHANCLLALHIFS